MTAQHAGDTSLIILVPIYQAELSPIEHFSLKHSLAQLKPDRQVAFIGPEGLDLAAYERDFPGIPFVAFEKDSFSSVKGYSRLLLSKPFYERFASFEFMLLRQHDDGRLVLTALPSGRNATEFNATRVAPNEAVFENPDNDFPQRIRYHRIDDQRALARIDIAREDPAQSADFPMHRVRCSEAEPSR